MSNWLDLSNASNLYIQSYVKGFVDISGGDLILRNNGINVQAGDISLNGRLLVQSDISSNGRLFLANDASLGGRLFVNGDASMNGNLVIGRNITILGDLTVQEYTNSAIINTVTTNVFNVSEDLSLNGRIIASSDASFGGNLNVNQAATFGTTTTSTGLLTASNGFTLTTGTLTLPVNSIADGALSTNVVTLAGSQTLTNKTLTSPVISSISNTGTLTLPTSTDTLVGRDTTDTLTNKTITASGLVTTNAGLTVASGQTLTLTGATITGLAASSVTGIAGTYAPLSSPALTGTTTTAAVTCSGLVTANAGLTVASGQTLTLTGATITGLAASSVSGIGGTYAPLAAPTFTGLTTTAAVTASGLVTANAGLTVASGQILTLTGATIAGDVSNSGRLLVTSDASLNGRLFVNGDASFNGNLVIGRNITILGDLTVQEYTNSAIINTVTTNVFNVSEDLSLNGRIMASSDASFSGNVTVGKVLKTSTISESFVTNAGTTSPYTFDYSTGAIFYVTSPPAANFTANFTNVPSDINRTYVATLIITATTNKRFCNSVQINGAAAITPNYAGGIPTSITSGNVITQTISIQRISAGDVAANVSVLSSITAWY